MTETERRLAAALADRYRVERELGGGGMARVFVAHEHALRRAVVVKVMAPEAVADAGAERFAREVELSARLQHPNIVPVLAAGDAAGLAYYVMPYVAGESLRERIARGPVPFAEARSILRDVLRALAHAHAEGVVHRDVKPANVLLAGDAALVADFGIAKALAASRTGPPDTTGGDLTRTGTSLGTPAYMAPEQAAGDEVDARADLYAWGVMAYELLAGRHPFHDRTTTQALVTAHLAELPGDLLVRLPPEAREDGAARALAAVVMRCLAKAPADRPEGARAVLRAMDDTTGPRPPARRGPRTALVAGAAVAVAAIAGWAVLRPSAAPRLEPGRVAIATFENRTGEPSLDPVGLMAADWVARGLVGTGLVDVGGTASDLATRGVVADARAGESPVLALARAANAGLVISGAFYRQGDSVYFQADLTDANRRALVRTIGPVGALASAPLAGVERLRAQVIAGLAPLLDPALASYAEQTGRPPSLEAYRFFLAGERLFYSDVPASVEQYLRASATDSTYVYPLLRALSNVGNVSEVERADSLIAVLERRAALFTPFERSYFAWLRCWYDAVAGNCLDATREAVRLAPRSQFAAFLFGIANTWANRPRTADSVFRTLDARSGEMRGRIYLPYHHTGVLHSLGRYDEELALAVAAEAEYPGRALALQGHLRALIGAGRADEALARLDELLALPVDLGWSHGQSGALTLYELRFHGDSAAASRAEARLLAWLAARPPAERASAAGRWDAADILLAAHRWAPLAALADTLLAREPDNIAALMWRGVAAARLGDTARAAGIERALAAQTRPERTSDRCRFPVACRANARGTILAALGDGSRAVTLLDYTTLLDRGGRHFGMVGEFLRDDPAFRAYSRPQDGAP